MWESVEKKKGSKIEIDTDVRSGGTGREMKYGRKREGKRGRYRWVKGGLGERDGEKNEREEDRERGHLLPSAPLVHRGTRVCKQGWALAASPQLAPVLCLRSPAA